MRKILTFHRSGITAVTAAIQCAKLAAASLSVMICLASVASAQTLAQQLVPTSSSMNNAPISGRVDQNFSDMPTVDAAYSIMADKTKVQPAGLGLRRPAPAYTPPNACNAGCDISWYANFEALWLRREKDERFSLSRGNFMPDFDYDLGSRITVGRLLDCVNGWEAVYAGPFDWQRSRTVTGAGLNSNLQPLNGYTAAEVSTFNSANQHTQAYRAQLNSFEVNRRWWVWDVVSTMIGVRYVDYEEDFLLFSSRSGVGNGLLTESVDNQMIGAQMGADLMYPVSLRANVGFRGKAGVYANFAERTSFLSNAGTTIINAGDDDVDVAGVIEMGVLANYQVVPSIRLTAGYEFWYLGGIATISEQTPSLISPATGTNVFHSADLFLHGGSVGAQILY